MGRSEVGQPPDMSLPRDSPEQGFWASATVAQPRGSCSRRGGILLFSLLPQLLEILFCDRRTFIVGVDA